MKQQKGSCVTTGSDKKRSDPRFRRFVLPQEKDRENDRQTECETTPREEYTELSVEQTGTGAIKHIPRPPSQQKYFHLATSTNKSATGLADESKLYQTIETEVNDVFYDSTSRKSLLTTNRFQNSDETESSTVQKCEEPFRRLTTDEETMTTGDAKLDYMSKHRNGNRPKAAKTSSMLNIRECLESQINECIGFSNRFQIAKSPQPMAPKVQTADSLVPNMNFGVSRDHTEIRDCNLKQHQLFKDKKDKIVAPSNKEDNPGFHTAPPQALEINIKPQKIFIANNEPRFGTVIPCTPQNFSYEANDKSKKEENSPGVKEYNKISKETEHDNQQSFSFEKGGNQFYNEKTIHVNLVLKIVPQPTSLNPTLEPQKDEIQMGSLHQDVSFHHHSFEADQKNKQSKHRRPRRLPPLGPPKNNNRQNSNITAIKSVPSCHPTASFCGSKQSQNIPKVSPRSFLQKTPWCVPKEETEVSDRDSNQSSSSSASYYATIQEPLWDECQLDDITTDKSLTYETETCSPTQRCVSCEKLKNGFPPNVRHQQVKAVNSFPLMSSTTNENKDPELCCGEDSFLRKRGSTICADNAHALLGKTKSKETIEIMCNAEELIEDSIFVIKDNERKFDEINLVRRHGICDSKDFSLRERIKTRAIIKRFELDEELFEDFLDNPATENTMQNRQLEKLTNSHKRFRRKGICDSVDESFTDRMKARVINKRFGHS